MNFILLSNIKRGTQIVKSYQPRDGLLKVQPLEIVLVFLFSTLNLFLLKYESPNLKRPHFSCRFTFSGMPNNITLFDKVGRR